MDFLRSQPFGAGYTVQQPAFSGPLDLLLQMIEVRELDISLISLMGVTDQYLKTLNELEEIEPGALADFLMVASRLIYIKSYQLLPKPRPPVEEEEEATCFCASCSSIAVSRQRQRGCGVGKRLGCGSTCGQRRGRKCSGGWTWPVWI